MTDEENNVEEQEIVIETEEDVREDVREDVQEPTKEDLVQASGDDELDSYSKGVQNRIKKLTEKYRQEERDKAEAVRLSHS